MKLEREDLDRNLREFIAAGSGVIVGAPGAGKTHLLKDYCNRLLDEGGVCLYLPLDKLGANSESDLQAELELPTDLPTYLLKEQQSASPKSQPVLVIDAFDAARSESAQQFVLRLIRHSQQALLKKRWRIIVSVRSYDARKSSALQALFPETNGSTPSAYQDSTIRARHFLVPPLSADEVRNVVESVPGFPEVYNRTSDRFKALMAVPFNLWLAEALLKDKDTAASLSDINSEIQLLTLFWSKRVEKSADSEAMVVLLTRITQRMVGERTLAVRVSDVYPLDGAVAWNTLLSSEILERDAHRSRQRVSFSHNILFDFAVSVLLIEEQPEAVARFLAEDPSRPLFLRPSVDYFFTRLWDRGGANEFWNVLWYMFEAPEQHVRIYARLVPAMVMAREGRHVAQFQPLLDRLQRNDTVGSQAFLNLLQTVRGVFNGQRDQLWAELMRRSVASIQTQFAWELGALTFDILERAAAKQDTATVDACGAIGRQLLEWALAARDTSPSHYIDNVGAIWGVRLVARTFASSSAASGTLLERISKQVSRPDFPIEYFSRLTDELKHVWSVDPDLAVSVYETAFTHREESEEKTSFGTPILPLTSTRRQDFSMCQYHLTQDYQKFLDRAPIQAARAAIRALNAFVVERHVLPYLNPGYTVSDLTSTFPFRGRQATYIRDLSYSWDAGSHHDHPLKLADKLFGYIKEAAQRGEHARLDAILDVFAEEVRASFWWKRLLETGSKYPEVFASRLFELAVARQVIESAETLHAVAMFIEQSARLLTPNQREQLETGILQTAVVVDGADGEKTEARNRRRNRLLSRIPADLVVTPEAQRVRAELEQKGTVEPNEPLVRYSSFSRAYTEDNFLKDKGADPNREDNKRLLALTQPLESFSKQWQNNRPSTDAVREVLPSLKAAFGVVRQDTTADAVVRHLAWTKITEAAQVIARSDITSADEGFVVSKQVLLEGLLADDPVESSDAARDRDETYTYAAWSPDPVTNAAEGLPWLARLVNDPEILAAIETLSTHKDPSVRFLVVRESFRFLKTAPDVFWRIAEDRAANDRNVVVQDSLARALGDIIGAHEDRVVSLLATLAERVFSDDRESEVLKTLTSILMWLTLVRQHKWAIQWTDAFLNDPVEYSNALEQAVFDAVQQYAKPGDIGRRDEVFKRAVEWLSRAITAATKGMELVEGKVAGKFDEASSELYKRLYGVLHEIVSRLQLSVQPHSEDGTDAQRAEFYWRVKPLLEQIVRLGDTPKRVATIFAPTAHHFMEFLAGAVEHDPAGALQLAADVASASESAGYHLDSMAAKETVALAEQIVADHRSELQRPEVLADLVRLLDLFAKVGWPEALRLLWRLDEVFR